MKNWQDVQTKKAQMRKDAIAKLTEDEQTILIKVLELEWEHRHLKTPDIHRQLRSFIKQVVQ